MARIAFCQDVMVEYMGFMTLSAVLKQAGHTVEVFFDPQTNADRFVDEVRAFRPDVVGFSILTPSVPWATAMALRMKQLPGVVTVFGNVHAMLNPEETIAEPGVDMVCTGEGEFTLLELAAALDAGQPYDEIVGLWVKTADGVRRNPNREQLVDMDAMPMPDRQMYNKYLFFRKSPYLRVMAGRGCPFRCSFCSNTTMMDHYGGVKTYVRKKQPQAAVSEIRAMIDAHPGRVKHIFFIDEVFWVKNEWLRTFLPLYKEQIGLPFTANFRFGGITEDDIRLLAEAGASGLSLSTESGDEEQRRGLLNKPATNAQILRIAGWMHKYGINFGSSAFFGLPGDTVDDHMQRLAFFRAVNPKYLWTTFFQPYPKLYLTQHPDIAPHMPQNEAFNVTLHHDMYLNLPDRERLVRLKKVYYLMMRFPWLEKPLRRLIDFRIPLLFDVLFLMHFTYYIFLAEKISFFQYLVHLKTFAINPVLRRKLPLQQTGAPFTPPPAQRIPVVQQAGPDH